MEGVWGGGGSTGLEESGVGERGGGVLGLCSALYTDI